LRKAKLLGLLAVTLAGFASLLAIQTVFAHSRPIRFEPAPGAVLTAAPAQVTAWFTAELRRDPNWTFLHVTDAQGNRVDAGETQLSADRRQLTVALRAGLAPGRYVVAWRGFDDEDGAIFGDCYAFYVGQAAADQAIVDKQRLDGGANSVCARIEVEALDGTPPAGGTPQATTEPGQDGHTEETPVPEPNGAGGASGEDDSDGVPIWTVVLGVVAGVVAGGVGGRLIGPRA
jgi:methionine-rich copper-binding protein CopC